MKSIELTFDSDGNVKSEAMGFKGKGCEAATKFVEQALGAVTMRQRKAEYLQVDNKVSPQLRQRT